MLVPERLEFLLHHPLAVDLEGGLLHQIGHHLLELGDVVDVRLGVGHLRVFRGRVLGLFVDIRLKGCLEIVVGLN